MTIDCSMGGQMIPASMNVWYKIMANKILSELIEISANSNPRRNLIIIPMSIFNIVEHHDSFKHLNLLGKKDSNLYLVGVICDIECYLDLEMVPNTIILTWDKKSSRDIKIEIILNNTSLDVDSLIIDVLI